MGALSVTVVVVGFAVPLTVTPAEANPLTGALKTTVKLMGEALVGSAWPTACSIVTVGPMVSVEKVTSLSVDVDVLLALPKLSVATLAAMVAVTVPSVVMPLTATL